MIVHLRGTLQSATPLSAVVDVQGVGYEVHIPVTTAEKLPAIGESVYLHTVAVY
ncbi:MAG: OB-fold domain-containing protein, partial [Verrucomicrobiota bacterium]